MKSLRNLTSRIARVVDILFGRVSELEKNVASHEQRLKNVEHKAPADLHSLEAEQQRRIVREEGRQERLSTGELQRELEGQYGTTNWARRLIGEIMDKRKAKHR